MYKSLCSSWASERLSQNVLFRPILRTEIKEEEEEDEKKCNEKEKHARTDIYLVWNSFSHICFCIRASARCGKSWRTIAQRAFHSICVNFLHNNCYHRGFGAATLRLPRYQYHLCMAPAWPPSTDSLCSGYSTFNADFAISEQPRVRRKKKTAGRLLLSTKLSAEKACHVESALLNHHISSSLGVAACAPIEWIYSGNITKIMRDQSERNSMK